MALDDCKARNKTDPRRVFGRGETPPELAAMILPELDRLIAAGRVGG